jgi:hypothetical protein
MGQEEVGKSRNAFELKDAALFLPLLGSLLAITYEIGSFWPLGGAASFGLFSLSEHLLWAFPAIPTVFSILVGGLIADMTTDILAQGGRSDSAKSSDWRRIAPWILVCVVPFDLSSMVPAGSAPIAAP